MSKFLSILSKHKTFVELIPVIACLLFFVNMIFVLNIGKDTLYAFDSDNILRQLSLTYTINNYVILITIKAIFACFSIIFNLLTIYLILFYLKEEFASFSSILVGIAIFIFFSMPPLPVFQEVYAMFKGTKTVELSKFGVRKRDYWTTRRRIIRYLVILNGEDYLLTVDKKNQIDEKCDFIVGLTTCNANFKFTYIDTEFGILEIE